MIHTFHIPCNKYPYPTLPYQITYITIPCNTGSVSFQILVSATVPLYRKASDSRHKVAAITLMREMCLKVLTPCLGRQIADLSEENIDRSKAFGTSPSFIKPLSHFVSCVHAVLCNACKGSLQNKFSVKVGNLAQPA